MLCLESRDAAQLFLLFLAYSTASFPAYRLILPIHLSTDLTRRFADAYLVDRNL